VIVEAQSGHDLGIVTLEGPLVGRQMRCKGLDPETVELKKIYRRAKQLDIEKWQEAIAREQETMIRARQIAVELGLEMKIGDVEFQGDGTKAIFYYIADGRVDFRQLIKVFAEEFRIRIEMKQIGARQEAGRIGGTGPCGRELCCATWMKNFVSVSTNAARIQDISLNPQKLAGMCAKLKCCLNYEVDCYMDAAKDFPPNDAILQTADADYYHFKHDYLAGIVTYSMDKRKPVNLETITPARAKEVIAMNKEGKKPLSLQEDARPKQPERPKDMLDDSDLTRFDSQMKKKRKKKKKPNKQNKENKETKEEK
ncbi:MAG: regulatory iron-sulfur-containing complex subunit RicT, partial [Prevotella sp.]|nr:regulatory iron-sulfur-containing complex subunit RicT [Prevotella sp.]